VTSGVDRPHYLPLTLSEAVITEALPHSIGHSPSPGVAISETVSPGEGRGSSHLLPIRTALRTIAVGTALAVPLRAAPRADPSVRC